MKTRSLIFISHLATATVALTMATLTQPLGAAISIAATAVGLLSAAGIAALIWGRWIDRGLRQVEAAVVDHASAKHAFGVLAEFGDASQRVGTIAAGWDNVAANNREQARDIQSIMLLLDRRGGDDPSSVQLRRMLAGIGNTLYAHLDQIRQGTGEIDRYTKEISLGAEAQGNAVTKTTTYVEQMSASIDSVTCNAESVQKAIAVTSNSAAEALLLVKQLIEGLSTIAAQTKASEKRLRGLADPSQQISAIVETIGDIAARTDMLALNASIESIRAGEHGRGFAVVADEVRKLAEQAAQATREITGLLDSMRMSTQESISTVTAQRSEVNARLKLANDTEAVLVGVCQRKTEHESCAKEIANAAHQQLQLAQDVVLAVEQISQVAKASRASAESACWTMRSLTQTTPQFNAVIDRLRGCADTSDVHNPKAIANRGADDESIVTSEPSKVVPPSIPAAAPIDANSCIQAV